MLFEPDHGLGEVLDLRDVEALLRGRPSVLGRLEGGIQSEGRVEALERLLEPFQPEEGETFARPRGLVPRVDPQGAVVRLHGGVKTSRAILRNSSCVPETLVDRPNLRRMAERVRRSGELLEFQVQEALASPCIDGLRRRLHGRIEGFQRLVRLP